MGKKKGKKGGKKKGGKKGSKKGSGKKSAKVAGEPEEVVPPQRPLFVKIAIKSATFHKMENFSCNFVEVFGLQKTFNDLRLLIATRYDHTISDIVIFEGEIKGTPGKGELVQDDDDPPDWDDTLEDAGIEGSFREIASDEDAPPTHVLYYDYRPPFVDCALVNHDRHA